MRKLLEFSSLSLVIIYISLISCKAGDMNVYQKDQINQFSVIKAADGSLRLNVIPMLETLYHCPGIVLEEKNGSIFVQFVRCRINADCPVDIKADLDPTNPGSYNIVIADTNKPIKINYDSGAEQIWPIPEN